MGITLRELQDYIKKFDHNPDKKEHYFYKLVEEVGELSEVLRKKKRHHSGKASIKGTIDEELYDVLYYVAALANVHDIDLERCFELKEAINRVKWNRA